MTSRFTVKPDYYSDVPVSDIPIIPGGLAIVQKLDVYYIDVNATYSLDRKGLIVYDEDVIKRMIANIMSTPLGSEHFEPTYGSNVPYRLMDPISNSTSFLLFNDTIGALKRWMKGLISVNIQSSYIRPVDDNPDSEAYEIRLYYSVLKAKVIGQYNAFLVR